MGDQRVLGGVDGVSKYWMAIDYAHRGAAPDTGPDPTAPPPVYSPPAGGGTGGGTGSPPTSTPPPPSPTGWTTILSEDFSSGVIPASWSSYPNYYFDSSHHGMYNGEASCSITNGVLRIGLDVVGGQPRAVALIPKPSGELYARYSFRMRADNSGPGWKIANLLWPNSNSWPYNGEVDWPEGNLNSTASGFMHYSMPPPGGQDYRGTSAVLSDWHVYTTEWTPGKVKFLLDGVQQGGDCTYLTPILPMHWIIQCETELGGGAITPTSSAAVFVDWVKIEVPA